MKKEGKVEDLGKQFKSLKEQMRIIQGNERSHWNDARPVKDSTNGDESDQLGMTLLEDGFPL